jgi:hypothetical protein
MKTSLWNARTESLPDGRNLRFAIDLGERPAAYAEILRAWQADESFRALFIAWLAQAPYPAYRWETPPVTAATAARPFEFVLLDSPHLAVQADPRDFAAHFKRSVEAVACFPNLGGDARLLAPCPLAEPKAYAHLAAFSRLAPQAQQHALWRAVGAAMLERLGNAPVWLNTAGGGAPWLHIRLDDRPKYYGYAPYRKY